MDARERSKAWRKANPERYRESQRAARIENGFRYHLKQHYGITEFQYDGMVVEQLGACLGCGAPYTLEKKLVVDHDHKTGRIRGLLCDCCNRALGCAKDNPKTLRALAEYLERTA